MQHCCRRMIDKTQGQEKQLHKSTRAVEDVAVLEPTPLSYGDRGNYCTTRPVTSVHDVRSQSPRQKRDGGMVL